MTQDFSDNKVKSRFEFVQDGLVTFANYRIQNNVLYIDYVEAPEALRGKGTAGQLMTYVVEEARRQNLEIIPICGYAAAWLKRHA